MSEPFTGQIEIFGFGFAPQNWALCAGQLIGINTNQALFALLGTTYGGNGTTTFALPDLRGRLPIGTDMFEPSGGQWPMGTKAGTETVSLLGPNLPAHTHQLMAANDADLTLNTDVPDSTVGLGGSTGIDSGGKTMAVNLYVKDSAPASALDLSAVGMVGGPLPHENRMPSLVLNVCIALYGVFPSRN
jgi:microcystin-dependent protein